MTKIKEILKQPKFVAYVGKEVKIGIEVLDCSTMTINELDLAVYYNQQEIECDFGRMNDFKIKCMYHVDNTILVEVKDLAVDLRKLNKKEQREVAIAVANAFVIEEEVDPLKIYREILLKKEIKKIDRKNAKMRNEENKVATVRKKI